MLLGISKLPQVSEQRMHSIRWVLTVGWLVMIASLFWDPVSSYLTGPDVFLSPFRFDPNQCVQVQGQCLAQQPYSIATFVFWTVVIPVSILILLVFGHETWRRICPISFLSQIPRALGIQRKRKVESRTGATRYELVKIRKDSWLGKHHLYVQFALLTLGLAARLLVLNSDRTALGIFLMATIFSAIAIGYLYEGKSWCQYFCPMAPVQMVFTGPRGLLGSEAHQGQRQSVTQSMCRIVDKDGNEKSACVGCQSPCMDIDAERNYWETHAKSGRRFVQYGYVGLLVGFFAYYFLYAGSFDYLFSGAWLREHNQLGTILNPGFYLAGHAVAIPKLAAVPLTLGSAIALSYIALTGLEKAYRRHFKQVQKTVSQQQIAHAVFSACTFVAFNLFFFFSSRSLLAPFPFPIHLLFNGLIVLVSTLWLSRTLDRSSDLYSRESLANTLRRQLSKLTVDFSRFLEGRSMDDLKAEEVYVLAKVLPGFNQEQSLQVYKGVLRETLEQGNADSASSLEVLRPIRQELNIKDEDHFAVLTELGSVEPELLDPRKRRTRESQLRTESYRQALASMVLDLVDNGMSLQEAMQRQKKQIQFLKLEYGMTSEEEEEVFTQILAGEKTTILRKAEALLEKMHQLATRDRVLNNKMLDARTAAFKFLRLTAVQSKQQIITKQMLGLLEVLGDSPEALELVGSIQALEIEGLPNILQATDGSSTWSDRLKPNVLTALSKPPNQSSRPGNPSIPELPTPEIARSNESATLTYVLDELLHELDPLIQALALYGLNLLNRQEARQKATQIVHSNSPGHWLVRETAQNLLDQKEPAIADNVQTLIAQINLQGKAEQYLFQQPVVRVGSGSSNDIVLTDPQVAKHHAVLYVDGEHFSIVDLGSSNCGLYIGDKHLDSDRDQLSQGEIIRFGDAADPAITVYWNKQPLQITAPTKTLGTLEKMLLLFESRFFQSLNPESLIELGRDAIVHHYQSGEPMCQAGEPSDAILLLIDGVAKVTVARGTTKQVVGTVNKGETVGEMGVLTRQKRSASVFAASDHCRALIIQADKFDAVLRQDPEVARNLLVVLSSRLQSMTNKVKAGAKG
jgi:Cyclic nucleotide-binding domain/FHA domain